MALIVFRIENFEDLQEEQASLFLEEVERLLKKGHELVALGSNENISLTLAKVKHYRSLTSSPLNDTQALPIFKTLFNALHIKKENQSKIHYIDSDAAAKDKLTVTKCYIEKDTSGKELLIYAPSTAIYSHLNLALRTVESSFFHTHPTITRLFTVGLTFLGLGLFFPLPTPASVMLIAIGSMMAGSIVAGAIVIGMVAMVKKLIECCKQCRNSTLDNSYAPVPNPSQYQLEDITGEASGVEMISTPETPPEDQNNESDDPKKDSQNFYTLS